MLNLGTIQPETAALLRLLAEQPEMAGLTLIGGTALALQIAHRNSLDLDFASFTQALPAQRIDALLWRLREAGRSVQLAMDPGQVSAFKINTGSNLLDYVRDYSVDGVKLTFLAHGKNPGQRAFYSQAEKLREPGWQCDVLGIEGMKVAKTLVLADRVKSRDLYDLMVLVRDHGYSVEELLSHAVALGNNNDPEYYKSVLRGEIPLDRDDEGLEAVGVHVDPAAIYRFFDQAISEFEATVAERILRGEDSHFPL